MSGVYQTKQKRIILAHLKASPDQAFTAKELHAVCRADAASVGLATIYRQLGALAEENQVKRIVADTGGGLRFQYADAPADEFYLKCDRCGRVIPAHCALLEETLSHMRADHGFEIDPARSLLYGRCSACK